jgi:hypothetical protein
MSEKQFHAWYTKIWFRLLGLAAKCYSSIATEYTHLVHALPGSVVFRVFSLNSVL